MWCAHEMPMNVDTAMTFRMKKIPQPTRLCSACSCSTQLVIVVDLLLCMQSLQPCHCHSSFSSQHLEAEEHVTSIEIVEAPCLSSWEVYTGTPPSSTLSHTTSSHSLYTQICTFNSQLLVLPRPVTYSDWHGPRAKNTMYCQPLWINPA